MRRLLCVQMDGAIEAADRVLTMRMSTEVELWARNFMETHALRAAN